MGSGKSSVGRRLGAKLGWESVDLDDLIARRIGRSITEFWAAQGEGAFRDIEATVVSDVSSESHRVVATGGGVVLREDSVVMMRASGLVVWLQATPETLVRRIGAGAGRPILQEGDRLATLTTVLAARRTTYEDAAHVSVATDEVPVDTVVDRIEELWNEFA